MRCPSSLVFLLAEVVQDSCLTLRLSLSLSGRKNETFEIICMKLRSGLQYKQDSYQAHHPLQIPNSLRRIVLCTTRYEKNGGCTPLSHHAFKLAVSRKPVLFCSPHRHEGVERLASMSSLNALVHWHHWGTILLACVYRFLASCKCWREGKRHTEGLFV